jgi:hypothetical protein
MGMINFLQLVVFIPMFNTKFPCNALGLFNSLITVATFDILPTDTYFPIIFNLPETKPINERFEDVDYGSTILLVNLGTLFVVAVGMAINYLLYLCSSGCEGKYCTKFNLWLVRGLFWTGIIDFCMESYIELAFAVFINAYNMIWTSWGCYLSNIMMIPFSAIVVGFPIWLAVFLTMNYYDLHYKHFLVKYEPAY